MKQEDLNHWKEYYQGLQEGNFPYSDYSHIFDMISAIEHLRDSLKFYANMDYEKVFIDDLGYPYNPEEWLYDPSDAENDNGNIAREALKGFD